MKYSETITLRDGRTCVLRTAMEADAPAVLKEYVLAHVQTDFLLTDPSELHITDEQEAQLPRDKAESEDELKILAEVDGMVVGQAGFDRVGVLEKIRHRADFGISIDRDYWGLGIGKALTRACVRCARAAGYAQLELVVVADNARAVALYKREGFVVYGVNPRGFRSRLTGWQPLMLMRMELNGD